MSYSYKKGTYAIDFEGHYNIEIHDGDSGDKDWDAIDARAERLVEIMNHWDADLIEENATLRAENTRLKDEIEQVRCGCTMPLFENVGIQDFVTEV